MTAPRLTKEQVIDRLTEQMNNAIYLASTKRGEDRDGWLDDARYFKAAIELCAKSNALASVGEPVAERDGAVESDILYFLRLVALAEDEPSIAFPRAQVFEDRCKNLAFAATALLSRYEHFLSAPTPSADRVEGGG